jgi:hypothetical protein
MRVAVFFALMLMVVTPSGASESCMSVIEARQHFGSMHIYWHGADHCWDASRGRQQRRIAHTAAPKPDQRKWRDAMSEMVPDAQMTQILWLDRWVDIKPSGLPLTLRRVDIPRQATPPPTAEPTTRSIEPTTRSIGPTTRSLTVMMLFALLVIALPLAIIRALPQSMIYRRQSE